MSATPPPKVFISYSWTSDAHKEWVEKLGTALLSNGVDVKLDMWELKGGHDLYVFMEQMVNDPTVHKVLIVCDSQYAAKANKRSGGVGAESHIISGKIYPDARQEKFIPIAREVDSSGRPYRPTFLESRIYYDFSVDSDFDQRLDELLRDIFNAPAKKRPAIGNPPAYLFSANAAELRTAGVFNRLKTAVENQRPFAPAIFQEYFGLFIDGI